ncbi:hypothetical protein Tco_0629911 [Tanacetum coccineum]|uniref:Uncharacterized protein n=1 Tax=Tanacetum coccineum TaxID=301880 RepID=A0ABQ4WUG6_9ASTR
MPDLIHARPCLINIQDLESWSTTYTSVQLGKINGENIMKSINEGPFHMGTVSDVIAAGTEGAVQQGPVRARVLNDLSAEEKERQHEVHANRTENNDEKVPSTNYDPLALRVECSDQQYQHNQHSLLNPQ